MADSNQPLKILIICAALVALLLNWLPGLDDAAKTYLADAITDNLIIFATARSLNAIISVIQSVELSISLGAGVAVHLGELLDPLNDLIERFSGFVLYGLAGLGLQKLVLVATSSLFMKVVTTLAIVGGLSLWLLKPGSHPWLPRLVLLLLLVRFAFVVEVGFIAALDKLYFDAQKEQAHSALQLAQESLSNLSEQYQQEIASKGFVSGTWEAAGNLLGSEEQDGITELTASAVVELIVITLVRGLLLPLLFIWALIVIAGQQARQMLQPAPRTPI